MDDPWTTGFYSSGAALASRFIAQALRGLIVAPLNVKTTLNVKTAKCEKPNNR